MTTSSSEPPRQMVFHDRSVPACLRVSRALRLSLWGQDSPPLQPGDQLVLVLDRPAQAVQVLDALAGVGQRPALVVAWGLPERHVAALLAEAVAVVDGSVVADPAPALAALAGAWDADRFAAARALAEALAEMEAHLVEGGPPCA